MGTRSRGRTPNTPGSHHGPQLHSFSRPMGSRSRGSRPNTPARIQAAARLFIPWAPVRGRISNTPRHRMKPLVHMFPRPMGTRSRGRISNSPGGHPQPLAHMFPRPMGTRSRVNTSNTSTGPKRPRIDPFSRPMGTRSRVHTSNNVGSHFGRFLTFPRPWALFSWAYFKHVVTLSAQTHTFLVPWAPVLVGVSNSPGGHPQPLARTLLIPWAPVLVGVSQTVQAATPSRCPTRSRVPWAHLLV